MGSLKSYSDLRAQNKLRKTLDVHRNTINVASRIAQTALSFSRCKTPIEVVTNIINTVEKISSNKDGNFFSMDHSDFVNSQGMVRFSLDLDDSFYNSIIDELPRDHVGSEMYYTYYIYYVDDRPLTFSPEKSIRKAGADGGRYAEKYLMAKPEDIPYIQNFLNSKLRDRFTKHVCLQSSGNGRVGSIFRERNSEITIVNKDYDSFIHISNNPYLEKVKKAFEMGMNRSYIFFGPPGAGKSTIVASIIKELDFRSFTIENIADANLSYLTKMFDVFQFDAVIIEDIDHQNNIGASALATLEFLKSKVKVVLATANVIDGLNPALVRPGRIDEMIHVAHLTDETVKHIIDPYQSIFDKVKHLPVAYINEIINRIKLNGTGNIENDINEMNNRADNYLKMFTATSKQEVK